MNGKYRGLVVHKLKSDELAACHLESGKDARAGFSARRSVWTTRLAADVSVALLPKSAAAQWHLA